MTTMRARAIAAATLLALVPMPAYAADGSDTGLSVLETVGLFVMVPLSIYGVIWLLVSIPYWKREASAPTTGEHWTPQPPR